MNFHYACGLRPIWSKIVSTRALPTEVNYSIPPGPGPGPGPGARGRGPGPGALHRGRHWRQRCKFWWWLVAVSSAGCLVDSSQMLALGALVGQGVDHITANWLPPRGSPSTSLVSSWPPSSPRRRWHCGGLLRRHRLLTYMWCGGLPFREGLARRGRTLRSMYCKIVLQNCPEPRASPGPGPGPGARRPGPRPGARGFNVHWNSE